MALEDNDKRLFSTLERLERGQERFIEILEKIAAQGEFIKAVEARVAIGEKFGHAIDERVRDLEMKPGQEGSTIKVGAISAFIAAVIAYFFAKVK